MREDNFSRYARAEDGLRLHYRDTASKDRVERAPAVCLPGLARTTDDFLPLALALSRHTQTPRRVLCFDYRGRGLSDRDPDWRHYSLAVERTDFLGILDGLGIARAHFIGTSRGGLHILALAEEHPKIVGAAVFNDIGPVVEPTGLGRIKGYVGKSVSLNNFDEAITLLRTAGGRHFDGLSPIEWRYFAATTFGRDETRLGLRYDPALARTLDAFDLDKPLPENWRGFDKLAGKPVLTIRGSNSDLLSEATLAAMGARWPESETWTVAGQGHAPLLADEATISRIATFLAGADQTAS